MKSQLTALITLVCTSGVLNLFLCWNVFVKRHKYTNIAHFFILYTASISIYCFASAFGLMATTLEQIKFWTMIQYVGMPISSPLGLLFIMKYLGMKLTKKWYISLLTIPVISFIMVVTNDFHHLHYRLVEIDPIMGAPFVHQEIGIWYMIHGVFTFSCMFVAFFLLLSRWRETAKEYRSQLVSLLFGQMVPMLTAFLYLIGFTPPGADPVPMVLWLSSLLYLWAINSSRMFRLTPIAKDAIFNSINDGVLVLNEAHQLIEYNQACKRMFPALSKSMFGMDIEKVWFSLSGNTFPSTLEHAAVTQEIPFTKDDNSQRIYQVRTSVLMQHPTDNKGLLLIFTDITELKRLQMKLEHHAYFDELTQIYNRRAFFEKCEREFTAAQKASAPFTIILMDVDYFKRVNDTYGHHVGDQMLRHVVMSCQTHLKEDILFARYGGEEFILAMKGTVSDGEALANKLRKYIETHPLVTTEGEISVTLSSGVATATKDDALSQLLNKADIALYTAKREGRNTVRVWEKSEEHR